MIMRRGLDIKSFPVCGATEPPPKGPCPFSHPTVNTKAEKPKPPRKARLSGWNLLTASMGMAVQHRGASTYQQYRSALLRPNLDVVLKFSPELTKHSSHAVGNDQGLILSDASSTTGSQITSGYADTATSVISLGTHAAPAEGLIIPDDPHVAGTVTGPLSSK
ncbi:hypothetical protein B0H16DRAFT_1470142 [Mycena metata]|uniref:Uncharacterized protein n=1 Tax=Mycena metata TaxID=1033252 RepID=A0AAD7HW66_9AGAR|nr:hypothetical protein B0H16DRAFT_1470142 [Mycena metata]